MRNPTSLLELLDELKAWGPEPPWGEGIDISRLCHPAQARVHTPNPYGGPEGQLSTWPLAPKSERYVL
jgi:hypothetical protein